MQYGVVGKHINKSIVNKSKIQQSHAKQFVNIHDIVVSNDKVEYSSNNDYMPNISALNKDLP